MTDKSRLSDEQLDEYLNQIDAVCNEFDQNEPDIAIDRQIIAAAHRELENPNPKAMPVYSWWRRLSLPLYAAATVSFTAFAVHWLWPGSAPTPEKVYMSPVEIEVREPAPQVVEQKHNKRSLPEQKELVMPEQVLTKSEAVLLPKAKTSNDADEEVVLEDSFASASEQDLDEEKALVESIEEKNLIVVTGSRIKREELSEAMTAEDEKRGEKLSFPSEQQWIQQIIALYQSGKIEEAKKEQVKFKQVYPDYPIDELIEPFKS
ncbi:MAG: hypothetical protein OEY19_01405 [Gammaproteobacteria bacterium]|nr:hypothetical protein [Gammaproteobacteria bacterium]MDH5630716.1 hypothetical protein [Gammaproteobacteria bacterium]